MPQLSPHSLMILGLFFLMVYLTILLTISSRKPLKLLPKTYQPHSNSLIFT
nr:ATP synthase F0 subunit 8 [Polygyra cereolus]APD28045.1 ATP synthase F0 subunit 8 [Polygyra cereolus]